MHILIDIGNSTIVVALASNDGTITHTWRFKTRKEETVTFFRYELKQGLRKYNVEAADISRVVISSVVPEVNDDVAQAINDLTGLTPHFFSIADAEGHLGAALEVLAVVAYNQPVTKAYIEQVRGVDCSGVVNTLCQKGLLEERGRLELPGRPLLYGTTPNFLRCFCLTSLADLPELPEKPAEMMISDQDDEIDSTQGEQIRNFFQAELESAETENEE